MESNLSEYQVNTNVSDSRSLTTSVYTSLKQFQLLSTVTK